MGAWSTLEYIAIANETKQIPGAAFYLSSLQPTLAANLPKELEKLVDGKTFVTTTKEIESYPGVAKGRVCLLDPQAEVELCPADAEKFDWFVFGGILGR